MVWCFLWLFYDFSMTFLWLFDPAGKAWGLTQLWSLTILVSETEPVISSESERVWDFTSCFSRSFFRGWQWLTPVYKTSESGFKDYARSGWFFQVVYRVGKEDSKGFQENPGDVFQLQN